MPENERPHAADPLSHDDWIALLNDGVIDLIGLMPWSSNATFLVSLTMGDVERRGVYKPAMGENPLWDFPDGLYRYEVAAYELSDALGFAIVPETIIRTEAPHGEGSLQRFVEADFQQHYFTMIENNELDERLRLISGFDLLLNNADRKGGHLLIDAAQQIYGIDNGLCFHPQPKLRTVMWDYAGELLPAPIVDAAEGLLLAIPPKLEAMLSDREQIALKERAQEIVDDPTFPEPDLEGRPYPWPRI